MKNFVSLTFLPVCSVPCVHCEKEKAPCDNSCKSDLICQNGVCHTLGPNDDFGINDNCICGNDSVNLKPKDFDVENNEVQIGISGKSGRTETQATYFSFDNGDSILIYNFPFELTFLPCRPDGAQTPYISADMHGQFNGSRDTLWMQNYFSDYHIQDNVYDSCQVVYHQDFK